MTTRDVNNSEDIVDSRDIIERIEELEEMKSEYILNESAIPEEQSPSWEDLLDTQTAAESKWDETDEGIELKALLNVQEQAEGYAPDWKYGETLIRDSYFQDYAEELAEELGYIKKDVSWPYTCINWEQAARDLQQDYTSVDWDGVTYWIR